LIHTTTLAVGGMTCGACVRHITRALDGMTGVVHVEVSLQGNSVIVEHLPAHVDSIALAAAIRDAGYSARVRETGAGDAGSATAPEPPAACRCGCCRGPSKPPGEWANLGTSTLG
jgi:copper chaperone CopZ